VTKLYKFLIVMIFYFSNIWAGALGIQNKIDEIKGVIKNAREIMRGNPVEGAIPKLLDVAANANLDFNRVQAAFILCNSGLLSLIDSIILQQIAIASMPGIQTADLSMLHLSNIIKLDSKRVLDHAERKLRDKSSLDSKERQYLGNACCLLLKERNGQEIIEYIEFLAKKLNQVDQLRANERAFEIDRDTGEVIALIRSAKEHIKYEIAQTIAHLASKLEEFGPIENQIMEYATSQILHQTYIAFCMDQPSNRNPLNV
jgi:hypothetical protein